MNLNQADRQAFVNAVMDDVPQVDYEEQMNKLVIETSKAHLPKPLRDLLASNPEVNEHMGLHRVYAGYSYRYALGTAVTGELIDRDEEFQEKIKLLVDKSAKQQQERLSIRGSLLGVINDCRTLKQAEQRLPEFAKYLPADRTTTGTTNLPVANLIGDLTKMGWPKDAQVSASPAAA